MMGDLEAEVRQMMFKLLESEDLSNHSPIVDDFNVLK
jgi:hypothetical protein